MVTKTNKGIMTKEESMAKGKQLFGENMMKWRFICPGCGHIQAVEDFKPYKDKGVTPDSARNECIGRYAGGKSWMNDKQSKLGPCDYAGYGLFNICPVKVVDDQGEHWCFAFDEAGV